jgi:signal transduction histidine kinase
MKTFLVFTATIWIVSIATRYVLVDGWDGVNVVISGMFATMLLWVVARTLRNLPFLIVLLLSPIIAVCVEIFHWELVSLSFNGRFSWQLDHFVFQRYAIGIYMWSLFYMTLLLGYFAIFYYFRFTREARASSEARLSAHDAQLKMLRYQINPHFLFNALNSVSALVLDSKNDQAENMIDSLSKFLRFSLDKTPDAKIPLREEIGIIQEYLKIEKIRFSEKLETVFNIDPKTSSCLVPSLILQPAIENAIKHAISKMKGKGIITISSTLDKGYLVVCVEDNGPGFVQNGDTEHGIGLQNMRERLATNYTSPSRLSVNSEIGKGVQVRIRIPVEK